MTSAAIDSPAVTGRVVRPGDADYAEARAGWNLLFAHRPAAIVFAQDTADVVEALRWARHHGLPVRARSGRHALEGWNAVDGGVVIDVSRIKSVAVDVAGQMATVGAGLNQMEAVTALGTTGFTAPTGTEGTVGLVGATLGGGFGLMSRRFGMACDNLVGAEIVVATEGGGAEVRIVDESSHADLLWALRGAGNGNFGIVTSLTYRLHPVATVCHLTASWRGLDDMVAVFDAWQHSAPGVDDRLTSQLEITSQEITLSGVMVDGSDAETRQLLQPILSVGSPDVRVVEASWPETFRSIQVPFDDEPANVKFTSQFVTAPFPAEALAMLCDFLRRSPSGCNYFTNALRGAVMTSEPAGGSAFAHRDAIFYAEPGAGWGVRGGPAADEASNVVHLGWIAEVSTALQPFTNGAYVNVPNAHAPDWEIAYWGSNVERLRAIKATYDPDEVFQFEQGIRAVPARSRVRE